MINKLFKFFKDVFSSNVGYSTLYRIYYSDGKSQIGYYDRIAICCDKKELDNTLKRLKIKLK